MHQIIKKKHQTQDLSITRIQPPLSGRCDKHSYLMPSHSSQALDGNTASEGPLPLSPSFRSTTDPPALTVSLKLTPEMPVPLPCSEHLCVRAVLSLRNAS